MIKISSLISVLKKNNSNFFTGVPDSVLKELSFELQSKSKKSHIIASNEGSAVSIGIGHYLFFIITACKLLISSLRHSDSCFEDSCYYKISHY